MPSLSPWLESLLKRLRPIPRFESAPYSVPSDRLQRLVPPLVRDWAQEVAASGDVAAHKRLAMEVELLVRVLLDQSLLDVRLLCALLDVASEMVGGEAERLAASEPSDWLTYDMHGTGLIGLRLAHSACRWARDNRQHHTESCCSCFAGGVLAERLRTRDILKAYLLRCALRAKRPHTQLRVDKHLEFFLCMLGIVPGSRRCLPEKTPSHGGFFDSASRGQYCSLINSPGYDDRWLWGPDRDAVRETRDILCRLPETRDEAPEDLQRIGEVLLLEAMLTGQALVLLGCDAAARMFTIEGVVLPCVRKLWSGASTSHRRTHGTHVQRAHLDFFIALLHVCHPTLLDANFRMRLLTDTPHVPPLLRCGMLRGLESHPELVRYVAGRTRVGTPMSLLRINTASMVWFSNLAWRHAGLDVIIRQWALLRDAFAFKWRSGGAFGAGPLRGSSEQVGDTPGSQVHDLFNRKLSTGIIAQLPIRAVRTLIEFGWPELQYVLRSEVCTPWAQCMTESRQARRWTARPSVEAQSWCA